MLYRVLADLVLVLHMGFVLFVVLGGLLVFRWPRLMYAHIPTVVWGMIIEFADWPCPLTPLEKHLRRLGGEAQYEGGFIEHYITPILYPAGLSRSHQIVLGVAVLAVNLLIYWRVFARRRKSKVEG